MLFNIDDSETNVYSDIIHYPPISDEFHNIEYFFCIIQTIQILTLLRNSLFNIIKQNIYDCYKKHLIARPSTRDFLGKEVRLKPCPGPGYFLETCTLLADGPQASVTPVRAIRAGLGNMKSKHKSVCRKSCIGFKKCWRSFWK